MSKRIVAALDVGSFKSSAVIAAIDGEERIPQVVGVYTQPSTGIKKGIIVNIDEATATIANTIAAAERMAGITIPSVYININGKDIQSVNNKGVVAIAHKDIGPDDVLRAIESAKTIPISQDREILHIISREFIVDSQSGIKYPIGMSGSRLEVDTHLVTAPATGVQNLIKAVQNMGMGVDGIVFSGLASSYSVLTDTEKELGVMLLDIGAETVSIAMFIEGSIAYSGVVPLGSMHVTSDLAAGLQISFEEAERLKRGLKDLVAGKNEEIVDAEEIDNTPAINRKKSEKPSEKKSKKISTDEVDVTGLGITSIEKVSKEFCKDIVAARIEEILELVKSQVQKSKVQLAIPAGVVVTGGGAKLEGIVEHVKKVFGVTARIGKPSGLRGMTDEINDSEFATVQGLIKYALVEEVDISGGRVFGGNKGVEIIGKIRDWFKNLFPSNK
ncbi:cell division protein FtsA [Candidatus Dojkabacteria bacterium]|nr:cell division protein FtsA [Candidatus Dojkabacteria bacterium]